MTSWCAQLLRTVIAPLWRRHLTRILRREDDVDAVIFVTTPLNHLRGLPTYLRQTFDVPVFFYDGDVPASLPAMQGFASGFRIYQGADLSEYTAFISNSSGGADMLRELGAAAAHTALVRRGYGCLSPAGEFCAGYRLAILRAWTRIPRTLD